jgi:membrane protease subunit (stomatin/prohibitin family)
VATGGRTPFTAEVWFVNRAINLNTRWGTATPLQIKDPSYELLIPVMAYGQFGVSVENTKKFLLKLVGTLRAFDTASVSDYFKGILLSRIKSDIAQAIIRRRITVLEIAAHLSEISQDLQVAFEKEMGEFGLKVDAFRVASITTREDDPAVVRLRDALAKRAEYQILGTDFAQAESFEVMKRAASNEGGSAAPLVGAGIGFGLGGAIGARAGEMGSELGAPKVACSSCRAMNDRGTKFCRECGGSIVAVATSAVRCPSCKADCSPGAKFCGECGTAVQRQCQSCGESVDPTARYCGKCGTPTSSSKGASS